MESAALPLDLWGEQRQSLRTELSQGHTTHDCPLRGLHTAPGLNRPPPRTVNDGTPPVLIGRRRSTL